MLKSGKKFVGSRMANNTNEYRFKSSTRNATTAAITQILMGVISFIERMVFNQCFIEDYLGFYSLFRNIISVLSVAELGLSVAISYSLYAPFANDDYDEVNAILAFYRKVYRTVGTIILIAGSIFSLFIKYLVKTDVPISSVTSYFFVFLLSTVFEYYFFYKSILFSADQKNYIPTLLTNACWAVMYCIQIAVSIFTHSFMIYSLCIFAFTTIRCVIVNILANREYTFLKSKPHKLSVNSKKKILQNVKGLIVTRIGTQISNSTNGILISAIVGSSILGLYSNYQMITSGLLGFVSILPNAITASLGNIGACEGDDNVAESYKYIDITYYLIYGMISIILANIINPIISIFFGADRCLPFSSAVLICIFFYLRNLKTLFYTYKSSLGLYWYDRKRPLITGLTDLILSFILGKFFGFNGIILGTIIAYTAIDLWVEPYVIFKWGFHRSAKKTIAVLQIRLVFIVFMMLSTSYVTSLIPGSGIINLMLRFMAASLLTFMIFFSIYFRNKYVRNSITTIEKYILRKRNNKQ